MADSVIVLDYGTSTVKAGYAYSFPSEHEPRVVTPCAVEDTNNKQQGGLPNVIKPVQDGQVTDFDAIESLTHYCLYELLGWDYGDEGAVTICEPLFAPRAHREQLTQLMFEVFNVTGLYCQDQATCALYALGKLTGCVVDIGHGKIDVSTVTEGQVNLPGAKRLSFNGEQLTQLFGALLAAKGTHVSSPSSLEWLKENACKMADSSYDYQRLIGKHETAGAAVAAPEVSYTLPDGQQISISSEGYTVAEALLRPSILAEHLASSSPSGKPDFGQGIAESLVGCVTAGLDLVTRRAGHVKDICLCGGGALIPGLGPRLVREMKTLLGPTDFGPSLAPFPEYLQGPSSVQHAAWLGGAVLGKVFASQPQCWVTKAEYDELGPAAIMRKCM